MTGKKFFYTSLILFVSALAVMALTVFIVDPFFHYRAPNPNLYYRLYDQRSQNDGITRHFSYDSIITGTSMAENFKASRFDEAMNTRSIKVCYSGATYKELNDNLKVSYESGHDIKYVFRTLDYSLLYRDKDALREDMGEYPYHLTDSNPFNDVKYLRVEFYSTMQMYEQWREQQPKLAHPQLEALLRWAAMLHEVGLNINHSGLHRHSAYILQNSDLPGFNQEQQLMMATLVRYHRKAIKLDDLPRFTLFKKKQFLPLIQLLRLGVLLNNQRQATTTPPTLTLITDDSHWTLRFPHDWFNQNALVLLDLEKEQEYWEGVTGWRLKIEEESTPEIAA